MTRHKRAQPPEDPESNEALVDFYMAILGRMRQEAHPGTSKRDLSNLFHELESMEFNDRNAGNISQEETIHLIAEGRRAARALGDTPPEIKGRALSFFSEAGSRWIETVLNPESPKCGKIEEGHRTVAVERVLAHSGLAHAARMFIVSSRARPPENYQRSVAFTNGFIDQLMKNRPSEPLPDALVELGFPPDLVYQLRTLREISGITWLGPISLKTSTGLVASGKKDLESICAKVGRDKEMLRREWLFLTDAWRNPLMRPFTAKVRDYIEDADFSALILYNARDVSTYVNPLDLQKYTQIRNRAFRCFSRLSGVPYAQVSGDQNMIDLFNEAVTHACMRRSVTFYPTEHWNPYLPADEIKQRLNGVSWRTRGELQSMIALYDGLGDDVRESLAHPTTTIDFDRRSDDVLPGKTRVKLDRGRVAAGNEAGGLGAMWIHDLESHVNAYLCFREILEPEARQIDNNKMVQETRVWSFVRALRSATYPSDPRTMNNALREAHYFSQFFK